MATVQAGGGRKWHLSRVLKSGAVQRLNGGRARPGSSVRGRGPFGGAQGCEGKGQELGPRGSLTGVLGAGVRSQDFTLGAVGSHGWFVSAELCGREEDRVGERGQGA